MKLFSRNKIEGEKGTLVNLTVFAMILIGFKLFFSNIINHAAMSYSIGSPNVIGSRQFLDNPEDYIYWLILGVVLILSGIAIKIKFKITSPTFVIAFGSLLIAGFFNSLFLELELSVDSIFSYLIFLIFSFLLLSYPKITFLKEHKISLALTTLFTMIFLQFSTLNMVGSVYNQTHYINHNRLIGNHPVFSSIFESCNQKYGFNYFKYETIPVQEPCYFERYMDKKELLTDEKISLLAIYYGGIIDFPNFITRDLQNYIENYSEQEAVFLYQTAYESLKQRIGMQNDPEIKKLQTTFLNVETENYEKSLVLSPENFVDYLRNKEDLNRSFLAGELLSSLENRKNIDIKDYEKITYEDLIRYKNEVYYSEKSTLFNDKSQTIAQNFDINHLFSVRDWILDFSKI
jgi:uncharacterized membrane protein HdeD (DUF308 family)